MNRKREKDEHIERLYYMKEDGKDSMAALKSTMNENYDAAIIDELSFEDMVQISQDSNMIALTEKGTGYARQLIRAHRLAERLLTMSLVEISNQAPVNSSIQSRLNWSIVSVFYLAIQRLVHTDRRYQKANAARNLAGQLKALLYR